ncbi:MAG TPA: quinone-dependent dihydroorotate dehydrogenase [Anaerolineales bacterium]|nr:quinone-dependent dihydroorotate dehydrogenase [Anaerolineales bacterium]
MYPVIRPILFRLSPETAHWWLVGGLGKLSRVPGGLAALRASYPMPSDPALQPQLWGLKFPNLLGIAAGLDKTARAVQGLAAIGAGHVEVGTFTPLPQPGNPQPRVFRLPADQAIINRMGFPNRGASAAQQALAHLPRPRPYILGINLGKGKDTTLQNASQDYLTGFATLGTWADYVTVNISSPNTVGLRALQGKDYLHQLLTPLLQARAHSSHQPPILVKIAPDLTWQELDDILEVLLAVGVDGIIATNTTLARPASLQSAARSESGGLSGYPLRARATEVIRYIYQHTQGRLPIVGVGGIADVPSALEKIYAGASLLQIYTGLVYAGPALFRQIHLGLQAHLHQVGAGHISELVGQSR